MGIISLGPYVPPASQPFPDAHSVQFPPGYGYGLVSNGSQSQMSLPHPPLASSFH